MRMIVYILWCLFWAAVVLVLLLSATDIHYPSLAAGYVYVTGCWFLAKIYLGD